MPEQYRVKQGECLSSLAARWGLRSWRDVYDHPGNARLRELRPNPNVLQPGDIVVVPEHKTKSVTCATGRLHQVEIQREKTFLRLDLVYGLSVPASDMQYELELDGVQKLIRGTIADGTIDIEIPASTTWGELRLYDAKGRLAISFQLDIGHLDPVETVSGVQARLTRLGVACGPIDGICGERTVAAIRAFQCAHGLTPDGAPDNPQFRAKLVEVCSS